VVHAFDAVNVSVAHIYSSALLFTSGESQTKQNYSREIQGTARVVSGCVKLSSQPIRTIKLSSDASVAEYSHDGNILAVGGFESGMLFWARRGGQFAVLKSCYISGWILSMSFSRDDLTLAVISKHCVHLVDTHTGNRITELEGRIVPRSTERQDWSMCSVAFHPDVDNLVGASDFDGGVYIWDIERHSREEFKVENFKGTFCWSRRKGRTDIFIGRTDGRLEMWQVNPPQKSRLFSPPDTLDTVTAIASSSDGSWVASGSSRGTLVVYDITAGNIVHSIITPDRIMSICFLTPKPLVAFAHGRRASLLHLDTGRATKCWGEHSDFVRSVAFSPNGEFLASTSYDNTVSIWETADHTSPIPTAIHHSKAISSTHFSDDSQFVVSTSADKTIKVWDAHTGMCCKTVKGLTLMAQDAIILPGNDHILSFDTESLILWNWRTGEKLATNDTSSSIQSIFPYNQNISVPRFFSADRCPHTGRHTVSCWSIETSNNGDISMRITASGILVDTADGKLLVRTVAISHRGSPDVEYPIILAESSSGKLFSAIWKGFAATSDDSYEKLLFVEEHEPSSLKDSLLPLLHSEAYCHQSIGMDWILDRQGRRLLWVPPANRGHARWHGRKLLIEGRSGRLTLVDFSETVLDSNAI
jgi:WD40 repeat protein